MYDRMLEQTNEYFFLEGIHCTLVVIPSDFIPKDFKSDKNQKIMFFGDIYLYF